jgi:hypothetical protein
MFRQTNHPTGKRKTLIPDVTKERTTGQELMLLPDSIGL